MPWMVLEMRAETVTRFRSAGGLQVCGLTFEPSKEAPVLAASGGVVVPFSDI